VTSELVVRSIVDSDFAGWLPLWRGYNAFYGRPAFPDAVTRVTWARFLDPAEPVHALVAEAGDRRLVGLTHYLFHRSTILVGPSCYLQDLYTDEASRGQGAGRALIEAVRERARAASAERLYWHTHATNATARALYDRLAEDSGFIVYRMPLA